MLYYKYTFFTEQIPFICAKAQKKYKEFCTFA